MSRRIDIELTSTRGDGTWTWRAAGAKQPKGEIDSSMVPGGAKVGDVLRVEAETYIDGITVTAVIPTKDTRPEPARLEIVGSRPGDEALVTTTLAERRGGRGRERERPRSDSGRLRGPRPDRPERPASERAERPRPSRPRREPATERPARRERPAPAPVSKPARLRAGRAHRNAVLAELPEEQKPIAEQILRGGIPAVRQAVEKQNAAARAQGQPEVKADALLAFAEGLLPRLRAAEWRDKADAALAGVAELDLRDLRTVVVAADTAARDDEARAVARQLRDALAARVDGEHTAWLDELAELLRDGRTVRALRLSSRPPKAGAPLPAELMERLTAAASEALTADVSQDRWATLVDAIALSPVRVAVTPAGVPAEPNDELKATIARVGARVPQIAARFGITPESSSARRPPAGARARRPARGARAVSPPAPAELPAAGEAPEEATAPAEGAAPESGDGAQDAVLVEELGEAIDQ